MAEPGVADGGAVADGDGSAAARVDGGSGEAVARAAGGVSTPARPVVLPEIFDGTKSWDEWVFHFESVAAVNGWDETDKLKWLRVRVTGRAQKALHLLPEAARGTYTTTKTALKARFDPESRHTRYQAEFQARRKRAAEGWADLADDLKAPSDKAYPTLPDEAREQLAINAYLQQLAPPQVAFSVKQKRPATLDDAVATTLEMESYVAPMPLNVSLAQPEEHPCARVSDEDKLEQLSRMVERLAEQVERLQVQQEPRARPRRTRTFAGQCWKCQQPGHMARECPQRSAGQQGN